MRTILTRVLQVFSLLFLVSCIQYPVDFSDPSVLRGNLTGTISSVCNVHVYQSAWSPDGTKIATIDDKTGGRLIIWDSQTGTMLSSVDKLNFAYSVGFLNWSADGKWVVFNDGSQLTKKLYTYNVEMQVLQPNAVLEDGQKYWLTKISASGNRIMGYYEDRIQGAVNPFGANFRIWDSNTGKIVFSKHFDLSVYPSFAITHDGQEFAVWLDGVMQTWSVASGQKTQEWKVPAQSLDGLTYSNNDQSLNALAFIGTNLNPSSQFVRLDKNSLEIFWQSKSAVYNLYHFSPDGQSASIIVYSGSQGQNKLLNLNTGESTQIPTGFGYWSPGLFSPDGQSLLYANSQSCDVKSVAINGGQTRVFTLETLENQTISLQLLATWQDKSHYAISGTATLNNQSGLTVQGMGYAADNEYFVNPRTPALRPRRAELKFYNSSGTQVGFAMVWAFLSTGEPNVFRGDFFSDLNSNTYFQLVLNRNP
jgi:WD40 repeat protein